MAIFGKIKKAFGFSEAEYEEEENNEIERSATVIPLNQRKSAPQTLTVPVADNNNPAESTDNNGSLKSAENLPELPDTLPDEIFDTVVRIFNDAQPSFIRDSINPEAQRKIIYDALSDSMKAYVADLQRIARTRTEMEWSNERQRLRIEMDNIQSRSKKIEDTNAEWKEQKLSAERQKRALSERVHDLEKQIVAFEAEKEQYELENKSLVNKLRAVSVQEGEAGTLAEENASLREEIVKLKNAAAQAGDALIDHEAFDAVTKERDSLMNDVALLKKRCEIADAMINDLNHRASSAQKSLGERDQQLAEARAALENAEADTSLSEENHKLQLEIESSNKDLANTREELTQAREELEEANQLLHELEETLSKFEEIKSNKDSVIGRLKADIAEKQQLIDRSDEEIQSLKSTIENNLKLQASSEAVLRQEIENLKNSGEYNKPKRRKQRPKISSIDDSLDDTDWLIATPPAGTNARPSGVPDSEFGYQEPKRKENPPENSAQMSLW